MSKKDIIERFYKNVKGKIIDTSEQNKNHDGKEGHWLEKNMGIKLNYFNKPDIFGYEKRTCIKLINFGRL